MLSSDRGRVGRHALRYQELVVAVRVEQIRNQVLIISYVDCRKDQTCIIIDPDRNRREDNLIRSLARFSFDGFSSQSVHRGGTSSSHPPWCWWDLYRMFHQFGAHKCIGKQSRPRSSPRMKSTCLIVVWMPFECLGVDWTRTSYKSYLISPIRPVWTTSRVGANQKTFMHWWRIAAENSPWSIAAATTIPKLGDLWIIRALLALGKTGSYLL